MRLRIYTKPDCGLCDDLKEGLLALQPEFGLVWEERNIEEDAQDFARFRYLIPVLEIEGGELLYPPHSLPRLYQVLRTARANHSEP